MDLILLLALEALSWVELGKMSYLSAIRRSAKQLGISSKRIIAKANFIVRNVLHRKNFVDHILDLALVPAALEDFNLGNQSFLRIFVFEAKFASKSVDELTKLARAGRSILGWKSMMPVEKFLGEVLRVARGKVLSGLDDIGRISIQAFYPEWFVKYCIHMVGRRETLRLLKYEGPAPRYVRINTLKGNEETILKEISCAGIVLEKVENLPYLYRVRRGSKMLTELEAYSDRLFSFQDIPSCLAALFASASPGSKVLEVGVRPLSKTIYQAQLMRNDGTIFSLDSSARMVENLVFEAEKANAEIVRPMVETLETPIINEKVDSIILSPPSSATGVFWRKPSLKWRIDLKNVEHASNAQWDMLSKYAYYVKEGGSLVYWTNSLTLEENELLIERFLKLNPEFSLVEAVPSIGVSGLREQRECQRLYPYLHGVDGSFFAKLIKD